MVSRVIIDLFLFFSVAGLQCISCAYLTFDTGIDVINDVIDKELNFSDTECTDNSQSQGVIVCEEGEVCMAIKTALTVTVEALGAGEHRLPLSF